MGQISSTECQCRENIFHMCTPEDAQKNTQQQTHEIEVPSYQAHGSLTHSSAADLSEATLSGNGPVKVTAFTVAADEVFAAPPPEVRSSTSSPKREQVDYSSHIDVSVDDILSNPDHVEELVYGEAFAMFLRGQHGVVGLDSTSMRDFICTNTCISMQDIDVEMLKVASSEEGLSLSDFLLLMRQFPIADDDCIVQFVSMSADGENLAAEECRSALLVFMQHTFTTHFSDEQWERIFNTVMWDADVTVLMEQWLHYCKLTARIVRLLRYNQIRKSAQGQSSSSGRPVRGGA